MYRIFSCLISLEPYNSPMTCKGIIMSILEMRKLRPGEVNKQVACDPTTSKSQGWTWNPGFWFPGLISFYSTLLSHVVKILSVREEVGRAYQMVEPAGAEAQRQKLSETSWARVSLCTHIYGVSFCVQIPFPELHTGIASRALKNTRAWAPTPGIRIQFWWGMAWASGVSRWSRPTLHEKTVTFSR